MVTRENALVLDAALVRIRRGRHGLICFNRNDVPIGSSIDLYGEWAENELSLMTPYIAPGATVLDVGANIGTHTLFFANRVGSSGAVYSFEPQPTVFRILTTNLLLNDLHWCHAIEAAVSQEAGSGWLPSYDHHKERNYGAIPLNAHNPGVPIFPGEMENRVTVRTVSIDGLGLKRCDLIKIDAEGMELEVLEGASSTTQRFRPVIYAENNSPERSKSVLAWLFQHGYRVWFHVPYGFNPENFYGNLTNHFGAAREFNLLALPENPPPPAGLRIAMSVSDYPE